MFGCTFLAQMQFPPDASDNLCIGYDGFVLMAFITEHTASLLLANIYPS
jgi:hypothetical protein